MDQQFPVHRAIIVVDVERFGDRSRTDLNQLAIRKALYEALVHAFRKSRIAWATCESEDRGDGALILIPPDVPKTRMVTIWPAALAAAVTRHNAGCAAPERMRLRLALHAGEVYHDVHGVAGTAVNHTFRLAEAPALKSALAASSGVLALIVSDWLYGEVIRHDPAAVPGLYQQVQVTVKETSAVAWIRVPEPGIGQLLRQLRTSAGLTQRELAARSKVSARAISDLERGRYQTARTQTVRLLAKGLALTGLARVQFEQAAITGPAGPVGPAVQGLPAVARSLPPRIAGFTGRTAELELLLAAVADGADASDGTVCVIDGMAGAGKTELAVRAAHRLAPEFPDGCVFVRLGGHGDDQRPVEPEHVLEALLLQDGVAASAIPGGLEARAGFWRERMAGRRVLVVLDDASGSRQVRPLLPHTVGSMVIITSRQMLTALPGTVRIPVDELAPDEAARMFAETASRPDVRATDEAVAAIVRLCGYLPLAISLVAGQLRYHGSWTADGLATDLAAAGDRLALMTAENESVSAAFALTYENLAPDLQRLFRRLGLQAGADFDVYAAAALDDATPDQTRGRLDRLFGCHLVNEPHHGRYRCHELIREQSRLLAADEPSAERAAATRRLLNYYLYTARAADEYLARRTPARMPDAAAVPAHAPVFGTRPDALAWMIAERLNLHAAVGAASSPEHLGYAGAIATAMHGFLRTEGYFDQARALFDTVIGAAEACGDRLRAADALTDLGNIQRAVGDYDAATGSLTTAVVLYRADGQALHAEASALLNLGGLHYTIGDYPAAADNLATALKIFRDYGDRLGEVTALDHLGTLMHARGDFPGARASLVAALDLCVSLGHDIAEASARNHLGVVQLADGDYRAAAASQERAIALYTAQGDRGGQATARNNLAAVQLATGDYAAAVGNLTQAMELYQERGIRHGQANVLNHLGMARHAAGDYQAAIRCQTEALKLYRRMGDPLGQADALNYMGAAQRDAGKFRAAEQNLTRALGLYRAGDDPASAIIALNNLGELRLMMDNITDARANFAEALAALDEIRSLPDQARALEGIGRCDLRAGQAPAAASFLREALAIYAGLGSPRAGQIDSLLREHGL
jgi:tetratricopeptide (TPR) repeat protein